MKAPDVDEDQAEAENDRQNLAGIRHQRQAADNEYLPNNPEECIVLTETECLK